MAKPSNAGMMTVTLTDEGRLLTMKTILGYEAGVRGLTVGQTFAQLVMEAADIGSYPDEVRAQLAEIEQRRARRAAEYSLKVAS